VIIAGVAAALPLAWLAHYHAQSCAMQCGSPYYLDVGFPTGTPVSAIQAAERACRREPGVIDVGVAVNPGPYGPYVVFYTQQMAVSPGLARCLHHQPVAITYAYPD
jgi:hypothetical protein